MTKNLNASDPTGIVSGPEQEQEQVVNQSRAIVEPDKAKLRVNNIRLMISFYRDALGFELIGDFPNAALLEIAATNGGCTQAIGLFQHPAHPRPEPGAVDRISFSIPPEACGAKRRRFEKLGLRMNLKHPDRICLHDPEGNEVELICRNF